MALITCPECGGTVSNTAETCPHCGYNLNRTTAVASAARSAYDVMLVDYNGTKFFAKKELAEILDCTQSEAKNILDEVPAYLYNDIPEDEARIIAEELKESDMRAAVYDPNGNVQYYTPVNYIKPMPPLVHIERRPRRIAAPPRPRRERHPKQPKEGLGRLFGNKQQPRQAEPKMQQPRQSQPRKSEPRQSRPAASKPAQSRPAQSRPAQSRPAQSRPSASRPAQSRPQGSKSPGQSRSVGGHGSSRGPKGR